MVQVLEDIRALQQLPDGLHLLCPRTTVDDDTLYYDEDLQAAVENESEDNRKVRLEAVESANARKTQVLDALQIFAYDGEQAVIPQEWLKHRLDAQLATCDICVRVYHQSRSELRHRLLESYDDEDIEAFMQRFDTLNIERISKRLDHAANVLLRLDPENRKIGALGQAEVFGMFEALSCEPFLQREELLRKHFDEPFQLVQTKRKLKLVSLLPAATEFLFSAAAFRHEWALFVWNRDSSAITKSDFDFSVRGAFFRAMARVQITNLELQFLPQFWKGARIIARRLNKDLVTHGLRAMDFDIYKMSLDHMQLNSPAFVDLMGTLQILLQISPGDFWESMGSIAPATVIEQVFASPALERILMTAAGESDDNLGATEIADALGWIEPFLSSLQAMTQPPACRALVHGLLGRCQLDKYPEATRAACFELGLRSLLQSMTVIGKENINSLIPASVADILALVSQHLSIILQQTRGVKNDEAKVQPTAVLALEIVEKALSLDCLVLRKEKDIIRKQDSLGSERHVRSDKIWQRVRQAIGPNDQALVSYALRGAKDLAGLEPFITIKSQQLSEDAKRFNESYNALCAHVGNILERVNTQFEPFDMAGLFKSSHLAVGVVSAMLLSDDTTRQTAIDLLKAVSGEAVRKDAILSVIKNSYEATLSALNEVLLLLIVRRIYTPIANALRFVGDVIDILCDSQDGYLRNPNVTAAEAQATQLFWDRLWRFLATIFDYTEAWGLMGHPKDILIEFCRDTMAFADRLFNEYSLFVDVLTVEADGWNNAKEVRSQLIEQPKNVVTSMVKWLRLRDDFLITTIVTLVTRLLGKLRALSIRVSDEALKYLEDIITGVVRAKLSQQQLAELDRAVERHTGEKRTQPEQEQQQLTARMKQRSIADWTKSTSSGKSEALQIAQENSRAMKAFKEKMAPAFPIPASKAPPKVTPVPAKLREVQAEKQKALLASRKAEQEARKRRDAEAIAKARALRGEIANQGSAMGGLSVKVKDHNTKGAGMMVSSDEESSDDDDMDDFDRELFGIAKPAKRGKSANVLPIEMTNQLPPRAPVKVRRIVRSFKDMRARLAPDLSKLHLTILSWEFFHPGELPPGSNSHEYNAVPDSFRDPSQYKQIFQPLVLLEAWQSFVNAREQTLPPYEVRITTRGNVDALIELSTQVSHADSKDQQLSEGDIVLLSKAKKPSGADPSCLARIHKINRKKQAVEVLYRVAPGTKMLPLLKPNTPVYAMQIQSITPLEREYGALQGLEYYDLCEYILEAKPSHLLTYSDKILNPISSTYNLNKAQAKAVKSALDNDAFTLIQGPPGSGKTKTIIAIVGALLSDSLRDQGVAIQRPGTVGPKNPGERATGKKLLVCAPSNAAVDELVMRLKEGVRTLGGADKKINVVRLGRSDAINANVQDVTLDELVNAKLGLSAKSGKVDPRMETSKLMKEHQAVSERLREVRERLDNGKLKGDEATKCKDDFDQLRKQKTELSMQIDVARDKEGAANRQADLERKRAQQLVIDEAHVICATLSGSGHEMFQNLNVEFETVVVDEAAQCVEMSVLIPLKYGCAKCILVGDPKQLPPTVFSREAAEYQYEQSLFVRMQRNHPDDVHLLDTQYRMHPEISLFPSISFYDGRLLDGPDMAGLRKRPWHASDILGPYWFFDVAGQQQAVGHSFINRAEIELASRLYDRLLADYAKSYNFKGKIGIITPYKSQLRELKSFFSGRYGREILDSVEFNTTDAFQGRESEIIIFSCVRASPSGGIGFLQDIRRMNVGLTRARSSLWVLGNSSTLIKGEFWGKLIRDAKARDRYLDESEYAAPTKSGRALQRKHKQMPAKPAPPSNTNRTAMQVTSIKAPTAPMVEGHSNGTAAMHPKTAKAEVKEEKVKFKDDPDVHMPDAPPAQAPAPPQPRATAMFGKLSAAPPPMVKKRPPPESNVFMKKKKPNPGPKKETD